MKDKKITETENSADTCEQTRRDFIQKFGKLAAVTPIGLTVLMTPKTSYAMTSAQCANKKPSHPCHRRFNSASNGNGF
ncbi:hypothetical protein RI845_05630 [Thalassotalea nanhaiensis]|uniref:Twin-arginine translocation signal domain-containing protein n=1 Tax=Thalassotalea nanhaiensis TaxID=3065648 RepID=A0ABY9TMT3_9GAMM|nr:hypothetical protein RI845_05630 [Colwelliaceae bacterium SQ345]